MKKILFFLSYLIVSTILFANGTQERAPMTLGLGASFPCQYETSEYYGDEIKTTMTGIGIDISLVQMPQKSNWGIVDNFSIGFPQSIEAKYKGEKLVADISDYDSLFLFETAIAPDYFFVKNDTTYVGIGPEFGFTMFSWSTKYYTSVNYMFGLGANLYGLRKLNNRVGIFFGTSVLYNFYSYGWIKNYYETKSYSGHEDDWGFTPYLGLSVTF